MAHFIGQIGAETGGLVKLHESGEYSSTRQIVKIFPQAKYGHLYDKEVFNNQTHTYSSMPVNFDVTQCIDDANNPPVFSAGTKGYTTGVGRAEDINNMFPYIDADQVRRAFGSIKKQVTETVNGTQISYMKFPDQLRNDITKDNFESLVEKDYNSGLIHVKQEYLNSITLFDVVYACKNGNSTISSKEGSLYKGIGMIHLTGKFMFYEISRLWNDDPSNSTNKKFFYNKRAQNGHFEELYENVDVAVKASMYFWKANNLNTLADMGFSDDAINDVGKIVNGSGKALPNDDGTRRTLTNTAKNNLK